MTAVALDSIRKSFGQTEILKGLDLEVRPGEFMVFVGPSGCGKSTLLRVIAGLEEADEGVVRIGGERVNDTAPAKRGVAMVFQSYALYPHMSVFENMAFGLKLSGRSKAETRQAVEAAAEALGVSHLLERKPRELSGGERQRVAIGRAIVREPKVFLFDEPLSNLDAALRVRMRYEFARLHERLKTTMIYVTHDQVEAMTLADRIVVLNAGRIEQVGDPMTLYHHPANLFVAGFIGSPSMNLLPGVLEAADADGARVRLETGETVRAAVDASAAAPGATVTLGIRPEHARIGEGENRITARARFAELLGGTTVSYWEREGAEASFTLQAPGLHEPAPGEPAELGFEARDCHLFDARGAAFMRKG